VAGGVHSKAGADGSGAAPHSVAALPMAATATNHRGNRGDDISAPFLTGPLAAAPRARLIVPAAFRSFVPPQRSLTHAANRRHR